MKLTYGLGAAGVRYPFPQSAAAQNLPFAKFYLFSLPLSKCSSVPGNILRFLVGFTMVVGCRGGLVHFDGHENSSN